MFFRPNNSRKFQRRSEAWLKTRRRGKLYFIITRGVLGIGLSLTAFGCLVTLVSHPELRWQQLRAEVVLMALFCSIIGGGWGYSIWKNCEERCCSVLREQGSANRL